MNTYNKKLYDETFLQYFSEKTKKEKEQIVTYILNKTNPLNNLKTYSILDMGCGIGSLGPYFVKKGHSYTGIDQSEIYIKIANKKHGGAMKFINANCKDIQLNNTYSIIMNRHTSFGYEGSNKENRKVLTSAWNHLEKNGVFILDYFNQKYILNNFQKEIHYTKIHQGEEIHISRTTHITNSKRFIKTKWIFYSKKGTIKKSSRLRFYSEDEIKNMLMKTGFTINGIDYSIKSGGSPERCIFICQKA